MLEIELSARTIEYEDTREAAPFSYCCTGSA